MKRVLFCAFISLALLAGRQAGAADGGPALKADCVKCHAVGKPENPSLERLAVRKGPDLYYAGDKFNRPWLVKWLQNPVRIRPAGEFYLRHIKAGANEDVVDEGSLAPHPKLGKEEAETTADDLMALTSPGIVEKGVFKSGAVNMMMAGMFFTKLRGCSACHMYKPAAGGKSGPELYTAAERLKPDYIAAYIKDPQKIDRYIWMPKLDMSPEDIESLTGYILKLSPEAK
ncbi:MAG: c-type cytochrome [Nitrospinae bacterium]|nr:c-type cytochrome [Nitrospinota bacterium]